MNKLKDILDLQAQVHQNLEYKRGQSTLSNTKLRSKHSGNFVANYSTLDPRNQAQNDSFAKFQQDHEIRKLHNASGFFTSAPRWTDKKSLDNASYIEQKSTLSRTAITFGRGPKLSMNNSNSVLYPGPGKYELRNEYNSRSGKSFGLPHSAYKKVMVLDVVHQELVPKDIPGPGHYELSKPVGKDRRSTSLNTTVTRFTIKREESPPPGMYEPKEVINDRFKAIGFGYGERGALDGKRSVSPGPAYYKIPSKFDLMAKQYKGRSISTGKLRENRSHKNSDVESTLDY
jgi:hypothetical protein